MLISILIPALNEEKYIAEVLDYCLNLKGHSEIIVIDGGSKDDTAEVAESYEAVKVLTSPKGRAKQMNYGAKYARGDIFLFLHADTFLPETYYNDIINHMKNPARVGGSFRLSMDRKHLLYRFYSWCSQFSLEFFTYGDHAIFIKKETFIEIGGYKPIPLMEDVEIQKRLRQKGAFKKLKSSVMTSSRRFQKNGLLQQLVLDLGLVMIYNCGVPAHKLKRFYPDN